MTEGSDPQSTLLRSKAERLVNQLEASGDFNDDQAILLQELRVHQAELEIQNQQLRETQEQLQQTLERADCLYHQSPVGYVTIDQKGQIKDLNESFAIMLGYPISRLRLSYLADFCTKESADILRQRLPAFYKKPEDKILDVALNTSAGELVLVEIQGRLLPGEPLLACSVIDRTQRKRAQEALLERENRLLSLFQVLPTGIGMTKDRILLEVNDKLCRMTGYEKDELLGKQARMLYPDQEEYDLVGEKKYRQIAKTGIGAVETRWQKKDGKMINIFLASAPLNPLDHSLGTSFTALDITHLKNTEQALQDRTAMLEQRTEELERFNYTASHDLRSPLVTVKTFLGFLEQDMRAGDTEKVDQDIDHIRTAAERMSMLLDDLLSLSRLGWVADQPERVSLKGLLEHALMLVQGQIQETGAQVRLFDTDLFLYADPSRLLEIWQNLIDNALTYGVTNENPHIDIGLESGAEPVFYVRDYGPGVPREFHEKIFGLFEKLDRNSKGSGLGLALVKRIVAKHKGKIWVEAGENGQGCCFKFTLPAAFAPSEGKTDEPTA